MIVFLLKFVKHVFKIIPVKKLDGEYTVTEKYFPMTLFRKFGMKMSQNITISHFRDCIPFKNQAKGC